MTLTVEQAEARLEALLQERAGYERRGLKDRARACDAEIRRLQGIIRPPARSAAEARPRGRGRARQER